MAGERQQPRHRTRSLHPTQQEGIRQSIRILLTSGVVPEQLIGKQYDPHMTLSQKRTLRDRGFQVFEGLMSGDSLSDMEKAHEAGYQPKVDTSALLEGDEVFTEPSLTNIDVAIPRQNPLEKGRGTLTEQIKLVDIYSKELEAEGLGVIAVVGNVATNALLVRHLQENTGENIVSKHNVLRTSTKVSEMQGAVIENTRKSDADGYPIITIRTRPMNDDTHHIKVFPLIVPSLR